MNRLKLDALAVRIALGLVPIGVQAQGFNQHYDAFDGQFEQTSFGIEPSGEGWMAFSVTFEPDTIDPDSIIGIFTIALQKINVQGDLLSEKKLKLLHKALYLGWADCCDTVIGGGFVSGGTRETPPTPTFNVELVRYDPQGDTLWTRSYGSPGVAWIGSQVKQTPDGGFLICGYTYYNNGNTDGFALKTDNLGNEQWRYTYGTNTIKEDYNCITLVPDGYILSGHSVQPTNNIDYLLTKIDTLGAVQWTTHFGSPYEEPSPSTLYLQDGRLLLGGAWATNANYFERPYVVYIDPSNGDTLYSRTYGDPHYVTTIFASKQFPGSDIIHAGVSYSNGPQQGLLLRTTSDGDSLWMRNYYYYDDDDVEQGQGRFFDVLPTADNGCIAAGVAYNPVNAPYPPGHSQDTWVVKVDSMGCVVPGCDGITGITEVATNLGEALHLYPNPVRDQLHVGISLPRGFKTTGPLTLSVTSLEGKLVQQVAVPTSAAGEVVLDVSALASGMYALHLSDANTWIAGKKFVVE